MLCFFIVDTSKSIYYITFWDKCQLVWDKNNATNKL